MRQTPTALADDYGLWIDEPYDGETCWIECGKDAPGAEPWMGVKYAPAD